MKDRESEAFQGSHAQVVEVLVGNHRRFLSFVERMVGDRAVAEDLLQSAFVRGVERVGDLRSDEAAVAWFYRLLRNAVVDHRRRAGAESRLTERLMRDLGEESSESETQAEICRCIGELADTLKPEYARAVRRVELEGASVQEFAAEAWITPNNASVRLFRAREALKRRVAATCGTCAEHGCLDCTCGSPARG